MITDIARFAGVNIYDYLRSGNSMLISLGSGLLMATMDQIPGIRYAIEFTKQERENDRFVDFLALSSNYVDHVCIHAWFSISKPDALKKVLESIPEDKIVYKANADLGRGRRFETFSELSEHLRDFESNATISRQIPIHFLQSA